MTTQQQHTAPTRDLCIRCEAGRPPVLTAPPMSTVDEAAGWLVKHHEQILAELRVTGSLMVRGLPATDAADFAVLRDRLFAARAAYKEKATPRSDFGDDIFSSTDLPPAQPILLHNENSYTLDFPGLLLFFCVVAPQEGGATTVGDVREALRRIPAPLRERFERQGWILDRSYSTFAGMPWEKAFGTPDRAEVEQYCATHRIGYTWQPDGGLVTAQRRPAVITHPVTGERSWFNHVAFWNGWSLDEDVRWVLRDAAGPSGHLPFDTRFGDGGKISEDEAAQLRDAYASVTRREPWQPGDLLLVDNILSAHGRDPFRGDRKILVAMGEPVAVADCAPGVEPAAVEIGG